jgi:sirohydrochlorin ferrochelatase
LSKLKRALLIVDRGSREPEVNQELSEICSLLKLKGNYDYSDYCFLEVLPPFIEEGIRKCVQNGSVFITIIPYFLYPGLKLKETVKQSAIICKNQKLRIGIAKPLCYHYLLNELIIERINETKIKNNISLKDKECDVLIIGHGSSDKRAREAFVHTVGSLYQSYRSVNFCFLELDEPSIEKAITKIVSNGPKTILIMPYFLHKGSHIKHDVIQEVRSALVKNKFENAFLSRHLGVDDRLIQLVIQRASEVETRSGLK